MKDFFMTNLNDILAYIFIGINIILYFLNRHSSKVQGSSLNTSLRTFVKNNIQEQKTNLETKLQDQSTLAQNIITQFREDTAKVILQEISDIKVQAKNDSKYYIGKITVQQQQIKELQDTVIKITEQLTQYNQQVYTDKENNK